MKFYAQTLISMVLAAITAATIGIAIYMTRPEWVSNTVMAILAPVFYVLYFAAGSWLINRNERMSKNE